MRARERCLARLVEQLLVHRVVRLVLEQADGEVERDRRTVFAAVRGVDTPFSYVHTKRTGDPALWVADAVGWAWTHGAEWRRRLAPLEIREVPAD